jgi:choline-glycine betaine transporter
MEDCLVCFSFLPACLHLLFLTQVLNEVNQNLLAVFSTYYLWIGLISVIAALVILCLPLRKQRLGNENQLILILAGLLYCTVLEWVQDY